MDYISSTRSNYFKVKDIAKFNTLCIKTSIKMIFQDGEINRKMIGVKKPFTEYIKALPKNTMVGFLAEGGVNKWEDDGETEIDFDQELSKCLKTGQVAVYQEVGYEGMRYLAGFSVAVNSKGEILSVSIEDIFDKVKKQFKPKGKVTLCQY